METVAAISIYLLYEAENMSASIGLGRSKSKTKEASTSRPFITNTGFSNLTGTSLRLDPSIRGLEEEALAGTRSLAGDVRAGLNEFTSNQGTLRNRFLGNEAAFTQARVNPLAQQLASRRGELQRSIGLRQLGGSSFGEQAITGFDVESERALGDARSLAEMENLRALGGIDQATFDAVIRGTASQSQLNEVMARIAEARSQRELASFGLGTATQGTSTTRGSNLDLSAGTKDPVKKGGTP